jgi:hypothetical protein
MLDLLDAVSLIALSQLSVEMAPGVRSTDPVDRDPGARLRVPQGLGGLRTEVAVGPHPEQPLKVHDRRAACTLAKLRVVGAEPTGPGTVASRLVDLAGGAWSL